MDGLTSASSDPETQAMYKARLQELNDIRSGMSIKNKEGIEKGREEERAKADAEKRETR